MSARAAVSQLFRWATLVVVAIPLGLLAVCYAAGRLVARAIRRMTGAASNADRSESPDQ